MLKIENAINKNYGKTDMKNRIKRIFLKNLLKYTSCLVQTKKPPCHSAYDQTYQFQVQFSYTVAEMG